MLLLWFKTSSKKNGKKNGKQQYLCRTCSKHFMAGNRLNNNDIISDYVEHKFTLKELSVKYGKSVSTMQRILRKMRHIHTISKYKEVVILLDTTYWGRNSGLMVIKDAQRGKILWHKHIRHGIVSLYRRRRMVSRTRLQNTWNSMRWTQRVI